ncbi:MAG: AAA family ATPase [Candidatus Gracilibacteria bacterium]|nr:AAA family ATPase [Candidatus Gracilibacteria bacterium]
MERKQKLLTLGSQTFSTIRETGKTIYVDKTELIEKIVNMGDSPKIFMSRPRRFGKSLLCSTFKSLFKGEKQYFKGLDIENKWNWEEKFPVIHIMFGTGIVEDKQYLKRQLNEIINENIKKYSDIIVEGENIGDKFKNLIMQLSEKFDQKVVIIIDEYDKPILDKIHDIDVAVEIRDELKSFYSAIKSADEYLRFVFITGVSKFSQVSLFSGLNQLKDITFDSSYATLCGYTKKEIVDNYGAEGYLDGVDLEEMKKWYNGYNFNCKTEEEKVYNPFGILNFFGNNNEYGNYWFKSATPTF